jgi:hypothetical protein
LQLENDKLLQLIYSKAIRNMGIFPNDKLYKVNWLESWWLPNRREIDRNNIGRRRKKYIFLFNNDGFQS